MITGVRDVRVRNAGSSTMLRLTLALSLVLAVAPAGAQIVDPIALYDGGRVAFSYEQTPFPGYSGDFEAEGDGLNEDGTLPPGATEAVTGGLIPAANDSVRTAFFAVVDNQDGTFDAALGAVTTLGEPTPGTYPVDLVGGTSLFGFIDDATSFDLPDTLSQEALIAWLTDLEAAHKLVSTSGAITLAGVDADTLHGTFGGTTIDLDDVLFFVNVEGGEFALSGADVVSSVLPAARDARLTAAPNPFNPRTEIRLAVPRAGVAAVRVYDAAGRLVRTLHDGALAAGERRMAWDGRGDDGRAAAAGTYLVRAVGAGGWRTATKVTLVP
ncbi:hypothetical protein GF314_13410 [bacterium]|nr:hypothetical protein [bacterium]